MIDYDNFKDAVDDGCIKGDTVQIVRKAGKIFDYVLPDEEVRPWELVTVEKVADALEELREEQL